MAYSNVATMPKKSQIQKFRDMARELEVEETEGRFNETLRRVARHKPSPEPKAAPKKPAHRKKR
jgi:hypothetical protein